MTDIAKLGFRADTQELKDAKQSLDQLVPAAQRAEGAAEKLNLDLVNMGTSAGKAAQGVQGAASGLDQAAAGTQRAGVAVSAATGTVDRFTGAVGRLIGRLGGVSPAASSVTSSLNRMGRAANDNINAMQATPGNIAAQFQDIGVTAAAGMSPMLIALQQGTQLSAAMSGGLKNLLLGLGQVFNATTLLTIGLVGVIAAFIQWVDWIGLAKSALNGLADILVDIAPYVVGIAAALTLIYSPAIIAGIWSLVSGFVALAGSMLATLGIPALIVLGLAAVIAAANVWRDDLVKILGFDIVEAAKGGINQIIGGFVGAFNTIVEVWDQLPDVLGEIAFRAANSVGGQLNGLMTLKDEEGNVRWQPFENLGKGVNPYSGAIERVGAIAQRNINAARGVDYVGMGVGAIQGVAGDAANWLRGVANGLGGSAEDGKDKKGRTARDRKPAVDRSFKDFVTGMNQQVRALLDANAQVGVYGEALMRLRHEQDLLNQAQDRGLKLFPELTEEIKRRAAEMASLEQSTVRDKFMEDQRKQHEDTMWMLGRERGELGLSGEALAAYRYETELLAAARAKNLELTDPELAALRNIAIEQAHVTEEIRKQQEAMDFARGTVRGFFEDFLQNARETGNIFNALADAVISALDRITSRLLDMAMDQFMQPGGGGNWLVQGLNALMMTFSGGAGGHTTGMPALYAKGGAFTNSIVDRPTLFSYANGASFGEMGEAGPEAVMPLTRGPDGSLGVQAHGSGGTVINAPVQVDNHFMITGAMSSQDIIALVQSASEETKRELTRSIPAILERYDRDGTMV